MLRPEVSTPRCVLLAALAVVGIGAGQDGGTRSMYLDGSPRYLTLPANFTAPDGAATTAGTSLPVWTGSFVFNGSTYPYTMVGTDPAVGSQTTTVEVIIVPLKFSFADGTVLDATAPAFGSSRSAVQNIVMSPLFQPAPFAPGGTHVGTTQYIDAFQRANFWSHVSSISPNYHVLLTQALVLATAVQVDVPSLVGSTVAGPGARIGGVSFGYFNLWLTKALTKAPLVRPNQLLIFVTYNTFFIQKSCCILGFHLASGLSAATAQTIVVAAYSDAGLFFEPIEDIHALSHELGEWMDDPFGNNPTPGWSAGQAVGTCQKNLEVGDPVTGHAFNVPLNGMTYHPEDLVFLSWFARQSPSAAVNGWYSFLNLFASPPAVCP